MKQDSTFTTVEELLHSMRKEESPTNQARRTFHEEVKEHTHEDTGRPQDENAIEIESFVYEAEDVRSPEQVKVRVSTREVQAEGAETQAGLKELMGEE